MKVCIFICRVRKQQNGRRRRQTASQQPGHATPMLRTARPAVYSTATRQGICTPLPILPDPQGPTPIWTVGHLSACSETTANGGPASTSSAILTSRPRKARAPITPTMKTSWCDPPACLQFSLPLAVCEGLAGSALIAGIRSASFRSKSHILASRHFS